MGFERNVFVNCPYDEGYRLILEPVLFTISYLGFEPRIALESRDSGQPRIEKIRSLIRESKYSIHDLSRISATAAGDYFRLNIPFELGLDFGCRLYAGGKWRSKRCLILEAARYGARVALSDICGSDLHAHENSPLSAVPEVRNWLSFHMRSKGVGADRIWSEFGQFREDIEKDLRARGYSHTEILNVEIGELKRHMRHWMSTQARKARQLCSSRRKHSRPTGSASARKAVVH